MLKTTPLPRSKPPVATVKIYMGNSTVSPQVSAHLLFSSRKRTFDLGVAHISEADLREIAGAHSDCPIRETVGAHIS